jgi:hypothetical protein
MVMSRSQTTIENNHPASAGRAEKNQRLLAEMDLVLDRLDSKLDLAEDRNWNLLVCCIGAELEAFREGREVLREVLGLPFASSEQDRDLEEDHQQVGDNGQQEGHSWQDPLGVDVGVDVDVDVEREQASAPPDHRTSKDIGRQQEHSQEQQHQQQHGTVYERTESEDEDPGPELLISRIESG